MSASEQDRKSDSAAMELRRLSIIGALAFLLFGLSLLLDGPVTLLAWLLAAAGFLCLVYLITASRYLLKRHIAHPPKADTR